MGTSQKALSDMFGGGDHPHAYGDKTVNKLNALSGKGSSPRVWGQVYDYVFS